MKNNEQLSHVSNQEKNHIVNDIWIDIHIEQPEWIDITTKPKAYVVGGQPGAGKSTFTNKLQTEFSNNSLIIELTYPALCSQKCAWSSYWSKLSQSTQIESLTVYNRQEKIYDSKIDKGLPSVSIQNEINKDENKLSQDESFAKLLQTAKQNVANKKSIRQIKITIWKDSVDTFLSKLSLFKINHQSIDFIS